MASHAARGGWRQIVVLALALLCLSGRADGVHAQAADEQAALGCAARYRTVRGPPLTVPAARLAAAGAEEVTVFRAAYLLARGSGTLTRTPLVRNEAGALRQMPPLWDAGRLLAETPPAARNIFTFDGDVAAHAGTIPFLWDALTPARQRLLNRAPAPAEGEGAFDDLGSARLEYLRGDRTLEGYGLRVRTGVLGDAVHGTPVFVGSGGDVPARAAADASYAVFHARAARRVPAVYLGANDGMLHSFDARSGAELFAYVPAMLFDALSELTSPTYTHRAYVDGPLATGEASIGGAWHTVLIGSPGAGARGLFALDVTDPSDFGGGLGALWEFTARDDPAVGNIVTPAQVARLYVRSRNGVRQYRHFAIAGNGEGGAGPGALFLLALDKPATQPWRLDTNYYRLATPAGEGGVPAGLSAPALVPDDDDALRHVYAGDQQGNLWRFDFTRVPPWRTTAGLRPVFVARDARGNRQPIAQQPKVVHAAGGGYLVLFGTGTLRTRAERDPASFTPQSFYAIYDDPTHPAAAPPTRADLLERRLDPGTGADDGFVVSGARQAVGAGERPKGWFVDFADAAASGEREIGGAAIVDGKVAFTTVVPGSHPCADSSSRTYLLDALSGLAPDGNGVAISGATTGGVVMDFVDGAPAPLPAAHVRRRGGAANGTRIQVARSAEVIALGTGGDVPHVTATRALLPAGRLGWREVVNWRQLHGAAVRRGGEPAGHSPTSMGRAQR